MATTHARAGSSTSKSLAQFIFAAVIVLALAGIAFGQQPANDSGSKATPEKASEQKPKGEKAKIIDATRVSTDQAAQNAAREKTKTEKKDEAAAPTKQTDSSEVVEMKPAKGDDQDAGATDSGKKPHARRVHGEAHGAVDPRNTSAHRAGAGAGASTKSGKTSVYVETERSNATAPSPPR